MIDLYYETKQANLPPMNFSTEIFSSSNSDDLQNMLILSS